MVIEVAKPPTPIRLRKGEILESGKTCLEYSFLLFVR
jgi:hypothetical protein